MGSSCALDGMTPSAVRAWGAKTKARYGVADETVDKALADLGRADTEPLRKSIAGCGASKLTRALRAGHILVLLAEIWTLVRLARRNGDESSWERLAVLGLLNTLFIMAEYRHALKVAFKIAWHGFGTGARLAVALIILGIASGTILEYVQGIVAGPVLTVLIAVTAVVATFKIAYLAAEVIHPEPTPFDALASVLDRTVTKESVASFKARVARAVA